MDGNKRTIIVEVIGVIFTIAGFAVSLSTLIVAVQLAAVLVSIIAIVIVIRVAFFTIPPDTTSQQLTKLLVIDDSGQILADFQNYLNKYQPDRYDIRTAADVEQAKQIVTEFQPQFAVVDLQLNEYPLHPPVKVNSKKGIDSELKGLQLIKFILLQKSSCHFIILSGFTRGEVKDKIASSFSDFPDKDKILQDIEQHYVFKGEGNYILAVLDKLKK